MRFAILLLCAQAAAGQCVPVTGETIRIGQLAASNPAFAPVDPALEVGRTPAAGAKRVFALPELQRLAAKYQVPAEGLQPVCFAWAASVPRPEALRAAMQKALGGRATSIEIIDQSRFEVPEGEITFAERSLTPAPGQDRTLFIWRGIVHYGEGRTTGLWAKVRIAGPVERVVAREALRPGEPITAQQVQLVRLEGMPIAGAFATSLDQVLGHVVHFAIPEGAALKQSELSMPPAIRAGDRVEVELRNGAVRIRIESRAERAGHTGETIPFTNLTTGKRFQARVDGQGRASVTLESRVRILRAALKEEANRVP